MASKKQQAALTAREAHGALLELKRIIDNATETVHSAEFEAAGLAIGSWQTCDPVEILRTAADTLRSSAFEAAVSKARHKTETAILQLQAH